ncbi:hypothetical protein [uncultured Ruminococcus sp.]|uniref:hypothetical protein n=1 Tax=uncultured Ruminococcus sp. TaxID=165186 RepID=UPI0025E3809A|nr:hypothetical protein [uncultured Ruminococcus sp.]
MMTVISEGAFLENGIAFSGTVWYNKTMKSRQLSFFDDAKRYEKITKLGDPLEMLDSVMDREMFRAPLTKVCQKGEPHQQADATQ